MERSNLTSTFGVKTKIVIDEMTYAGSAFGSTQEGDRVYIKANLIDDADAYEGAICDALLIQNFEDKRDISPWRAIRLIESGL